MNDRRAIAIRQTLAAGVALLGVLFVLGHCSACNALTPAEQAKVAADGVKLSMCASEAHLCKVANKHTDAGVSECWDGYEACMVAHGYRDGGR